MAKSANQKHKILLVREILERRSDEEHPVSMAELLAALEAAGVPAERKSLYDDFETLRAHGVDVELQRGRGYYIAQRPFQLAELKLLVDAVQSCRFITEKKSRQLIGKLEGLTSVHEAGKLQRQVYVTGRAKAENEQIYYSIDALHAAIAADRDIAFYYFDYTPAGEKRYRHDKKRYHVSPWALIWDSENYYLVAYEGESDSIRHYRVDKMDALAVTSDPRGGKALFQALDLTQYTAHHFGMFGGRIQPVTLRCPDHLAGVILDRFGRDSILVPGGDGFFSVTVPVAVSPQFFGWLFGLGSEVSLTAPAEVRAAFRRQLDAVGGHYAP